MENKLSHFLFIRNEFDPFIQVKKRKRTYSLLFISFIF